MKKETINVIFAVDDNYVNYLLITIASIIDNAKNEKYNYKFNILHDGLNKKSKKKLKKIANKRFKVVFYNVSGSLDQLESRFKVRDYYTLTTYYRLLIPNNFFFLDKVIYLDCDIVVLDDLANLYQIDIKDNLVGAVKDASVQLIDEFMYYTKNALNIDKERYFNAGVLLMNLKEMRSFHLLRKVLELSKTMVFKVAQDQDLMNVICKDRVYYLPDSWNVMPVGNRMYDISLIHYNLIYKPWKRKDILYQEHFFHYAKKLDLENIFKEGLNNMCKEALENEEKGMENLKKLCVSEASHPEKYKDCLSGFDYYDENEMLNTERSKIYEKIKELEIEGKFDQDVENDPPYTPLKVGSVDYYHKKLKTKIRAKLYDFYSFRYFNHLIKKGRIIIDDYKGINNLKNLKTGAIITSNHFSPFDSIPIHKAVKKYHYKRTLFKIIKEGNYTFPGLYGKFMRYCNSLPLASDFDVLKQMMQATSYYLKKGYCVLIYPEQSMWWNYQKPKPTKAGAFRFAASNNVPIIPTFITLRKTDKLNQENDYIYAYTLHILEPIYPKKEYKLSQNIQYLQEMHDKAWKELYESVYQKKLVYLTKE